MVPFRRRKSDLHKVGSRAECINLVMEGAELLNRKKAKDARKKFDEAGKLAKGMSFEAEIWERRGRVWESMIGKAEGAAVIAAGNYGEGAEVAAHPDDIKRMLLKAAYLFGTHGAILWSGISSFQLSSKYYSSAAEFETDPGTKKELMELADAAARSHKSSRDEYDGLVSAFRRWP